MTGSTGVILALIALLTLAACSAGRDGGGQTDVGLDSFSLADQVSAANQAAVDNGSATLSPKVVKGLATLSPTVSASCN